jgi:hypothetical protein
MEESILCVLCQTVVATTKKNINIPHHTSAFSLRESAQAGCHLCIFAWDAHLDHLDGSHVYPFQSTGTDWDDACKFKNLRHKEKNSPGRDPTDEDATSFKWQICVETVGGGLLYKLFRVYHNQVPIYMPWAEPTNSACIKYFSATRATGRFLLCLY